MAELTSNWFCYFVGDGALDFTEISYFIMAKTYLRFWVACGNGANLLRMGHLLKLFGCGFTRTANINTLVKS